MQVPKSQAPNLAYSQPAVCAADEPDRAHTLLTYHAHLLSACLQTLYHVMTQLCCTGDDNFWQLLPQGAE